jgi:hypothetical protein
MTFKANDWKERLVAVSCYRQFQDVVFRFPPVNGY